MSDKYSMKIPQKLADYFQKYIDEHPELGFNFVSQYLLHIIQEDAKRIKNLELIEESKENIKKKKTIELKEGTYKKEELRKLLEE